MTNSSSEFIVVPSQQLDTTTATSYTSNFALSSQWATLLCNEQGLILHPCGVPPPCLPPQPPIAINVGLQSTPPVPSFYVRLCSNNQPWLIRPPTHLEMFQAQNTIMAKPQLMIELDNIQVHDLFL